MNDRPLWTCPRCGRRFVARNMPHACGAYSVEGFLKGKSDRARELFRRFEDMIAACGPFEAAPAKTRVAFMGRVRFASVNSLSDRGMNVHFGLPRAVSSRRIAKVERLGSWYVHHLRISTPEELDEEVQAWLRESYHQMGMQERLRRD